MRCVHLACLLCHCLHEYVVLSFHHQYFLIPVPKVSPMLLGDSKLVLSQQDFSSDGRLYFSAVLFPVAWSQYGDQNALRITEVQLFLCVFIYRVAGILFRILDVPVRFVTLLLETRSHSNLSPVLGPAMAQAGSAVLSLRSTTLDVWSGDVRLVVGKMALRQVFSPRILRFLFAV
jgi:hypothetical protein